MMRPMFDLVKSHLLPLVFGLTRKIALEAWDRPFSLFIDPLDAGDRLRAIRYWKFFLRLVAVIFVVSAASFASGGNFKPLKRSIDPVTVLGKQALSLCGSKIANLGLFAVDGDYLRPIPFQIDEKRNGQYVFTDGEIASTDTDAGRLDNDDEIAFISGDAGSRLDPEQLPESVRAGVEIEVIDPVDGSRGYVYLLAFYEQATRSEVDYVVYDVARNEIETTDYHIGYDAEAPISIDNLRVKKPDGSEGASVADRQKVRIEGDTFWNLMHLSRNEGDFRCKVLGYIDGPVRVIRHTKNWQVIFWEIPTPSVCLTSIYWKTGMTFPITVEIPFSIKRLFRTVSMRIYVDSPPQVTGRRYYNSNNLQGVDIDGRMSRAERAMDPRPFSWQVVAGTTDEHPEGWFSRQLYDPEKVPVQLPLYYLDNENEPDAPEHFPGCYGCLGFEFEGIGELESGSFAVEVQMYPMPSYSPGEEAEYLQITDNPLKIRAKKLVHE